MAYNQILPCYIIMNKKNYLAVNVIYIFNKWLRMLKTYGHLDPKSLTYDFYIVSKAIRSTKFDKDMKNAVIDCRDVAVANNFSGDLLIKTLHNSLNILRDLNNDEYISEVQSNYKDHRMTRKFNNLSKRLMNEKIKAIDKPLKYVDVDTSDSYSAKLLRRIVEKRAAQEVRKRSKKMEDNSSLRHQIRRAKSYCLQTIAYGEPDTLKKLGARARSHYHPRVDSNIPGELKKKHSYNTYEEALIICEKMRKNNPNDDTPIVPYKCSSCSKWHIGHDRYYSHNLISVHAC